MSTKRRQTAAVTGTAATSGNNKIAIPRKSARIGIGGAEENKHMLKVKPKQESALAILHPANGSELLGNITVSPVPALDLPSPQASPSQRAIVKSQNCSSNIEIVTDNKSGENVSYCDELCDPNNPVVVKFQDVSAAAYKIRSGVERTSCVMQAEKDNTFLQVTPCVRSRMSDIVGVSLFFKKEFNQQTGSFKERGARFTLMMLNKDQKSAGVVAASAGNHALAVAFHGKDLGIRVTVVMPKVAPLMKIELCRQYGANVLVKGCDIGESKVIAMQMAYENGLQYINGYDHPHIIAGQGTMGLEIVEQVPDVDAIVIPVGGGGLIAGTAVAVKYLMPNVLIIGVESQNCSSMSAALDSGRPVYHKPMSTLADGLAVPVVGVNAFATVHPLIDKMVTVSEEDIAIAILRLIEVEKSVVEGAGATGLAALLSNKLPELRGKRVVIPLCGGNIDTTVLGRCLERGLAADGRLCRFTVAVSDRPGGIAELTRLIAQLGVSLKDIYHERAWVLQDIFSVSVKCTVETRDAAHSAELEAELRKRYRQVKFGPKFDDPSDGDNTDQVLTEHANTNRDVSCSPEAEA